MTRAKNLAAKITKPRWLSSIFALTLVLPCLSSLLPLSAMALPADDEGADEIRYIGAGRASRRAAAARSTAIRQAPPVQATVTQQTPPLPVTAVQQSLQLQERKSAPRSTAAKVASGSNFVSPFEVLALPTAVQFPVIFDTPIDSRTARQGNALEAHLKEDLVFESRLIAPAGSVVVGHIDHYVKSRTMTQAMASKDLRFHKTSIVKIMFDEIITPEQEHINIVGILSRQRAIFGDKVEREVVIGKQGIVEKAEPTISDDTMVGAQVVNFTVGTGLSQLGTVATFGVLPVVMGAIGIVNPSIITMHATSQDDKHPRIRGMTMGVVSSLPGGPVLQSFIYRGSELNIKKGDELLVQAHSPYEDQATTTQVSAKLSVGRPPSAAAGGPNAGRHYYPKYQPKYTPTAGNKVLGTNSNTEDRFGLWR